MNELAVLLTEMTNRASKLEIDPLDKRYLLDELHRVRGRMMTISRDQSWQLVSGKVTIEFETQG